MRDNVIVKDRFNQVCGLLGLSDLDKRSMVFTSIADYYEVPGRMYHNFSHIVSCFNELDDYLEDNPDIDKLDINCLEMAITYHDVFIDILIKDGKNEEISAMIAKKHLEFLGTPTKFTVLLIVGTFFRYSFDNIEHQLMCDIDYSILGQESDVFEKYEDGIYYEYMWWGGYSEEEYKKGRKEFLEKILALDRIYFTDYFFNKYEEKARENVKRLLKRF